MEKGLGDFFEGRIDLLAAFDPERNGIAAVSVFRCSCKFVNILVDRYSI